ncbi:hypothetical protein DY000_02061748 [Brassica cretica]|uniref:EamA domain-containing protein n=1 Tax=Brassica cretica TaxID=69181 RepID=A0ABQ7B3R8_BRACR|nr:hypothetical protein DY000_02061748 [Brassica cretica]
MSMTESGSILAVPSSTVLLRDDKTMFLIISLLSTSISFTTSELARKVILGFICYWRLSNVYGSIMLYRRPVIKAKWYHYFLLALVNVEANFLVVKAFQYTSMTSVMLLDCWAIPCVLVLTWVFLKTRYSLMKISGVAVCIVGVVMVVFSDVHAGDRAVVKAFQYTSMTSVMLLDCWAIPCVLVLTWVFLKTRYSLMKISGVAVCIVGVVMVVFSDVHAGDRAGGSNPAKGDLLVIAAATLYAVINTSGFFVKTSDRIELMSFVGLFGAIIAAIQIGIFERDALNAIHWSTWAVLPYIGIAISVFLFYSVLTVLLKTNGTAMFTFSLLTSDMWAVLIRIFTYHEKVDWLYYLAFATTAIGLIIYSIDVRSFQAPKTNVVVALGGVSQRLHVVAPGSRSRQCSSKDHSNHLPCAPNAPKCLQELHVISLRKENDQERQRGGEVVDEQRKLLDEEGVGSLRDSLIGAST